MLKKAIVASGLAVASAGLSSLVGTGMAYFLDPKRGERRRTLLRKRAKAMLHAVNAGEQAERLAAWLQAHGLRPRRPPLRLYAAAAGIGLSVGAGLMYYLDPRNGQERRVLLQEQLATVLQELMTQARGVLHPGSADGVRAGNDRAEMNPCAAKESAPAARAESLRH